MIHYEHPHCYNPVGEWTYSTNCEFLLEERFSGGQNGQSYNLALRNESRQNHVSCYVENKGTSGIHRLTKDSFVCARLGWPCFWKKSDCDRKFPVIQNYHYSIILCNLLHTQHSCHNHSVRSSIFLRSLSDYYNILVKYSRGSHV